MKPYLYLLLLWMAPLVATSQSTGQIFDRAFNSAAVTIKSAGPATIDSLKRELARARADTVRMWLMLQLSNTFRVQNLDSSRWYAEKSVALAHAIKHQEGEVICGLALAGALSERDIPQSMRLYLHLLPKAEAISNYNAMFNCYIGMGLLQSYLGNYQQAIVNFQQARQFEIYAETKGRAAANMNEIGGSYWYLQKPDSARYYFSLAARYSARIKQNGFWLYYRGRLETERNPALAYSYFRESIRQFRSQQNLRGLAYAYRWYSDFLWKQNRPDSSLLVAKYGLWAAQRVGNLRGIFFNSGLLTRNYQALGQIDSAYTYLRTMVAARDSLFSQDKINQIQTTLIEEQQRVQLLEQQKSRFESNVKIYGLLGLVAALGLIAGLFYRNDRQKQKLNGRLQVLNGEVNQQKEEIQSQRDSLATTLSDLRTTQAQLIQREKMASLGELTAGIAHEIQNPLNFVNNFSEVSVELVEELKDDLVKGDIAEAGLLADDLAQNLHRITQNGQRASNIVRGMLEHSRTSTGERLPTDLNALADEYLHLAYQGMRAKDKDGSTGQFNCVLETHFDPALPLVSVVPQDISRVLLNLFNNAFYAVGQKQKKAGVDYEPTVWVSTTQNNGHAEILIRDNGTGIPESIKDKIFQPFFTTKPTGEGTGLGLSLAYDMVTKGHGGTLTMESEEGVRTEFIIELPI